MGWSGMTKAHRQAEELIVVSDMETSAGQQLKAIYSLPSLPMPAAKFQK